jgi:hypothetical protein
MAEKRKLEVPLKKYEPQYDANKRIPQPYARLYEFLQEQKPTVVGVDDQGINDIQLKETLARLLSIGPSMGFGVILTPKQRRVLKQFSLDAALVGNDEIGWHLERPRTR